MGLSLLPLFLGKLTAGPLGGYLLARYSPPEGARFGGVLWLVVALMAVGTPVLIVLLRRTIRPKDDGMTIGQDRAQTPPEDAEPRPAATPGRSEAARTSEAQAQVGTNAMTPRVRGASA